MQEEIWKDIPDYEGLYQASNLGRIKSIKRLVNSRHGKKTIPEKILNPIITKSGYLVVNFVCGKRKQHLIHRLIISSFLGKSNLHVNHKDFDKSNNGINNLEYVTPLENITHSCYGERNGRLVLNLQTGVFYFTLKEAAKSIDMSIYAFYKRLSGKVKNKTHFVIV
jgi:hypothetical protein